jgi:prevent-host-death family protein
MQGNKRGQTGPGRTAHTTPAGVRLYSDIYMVYFMTMIMVNIFEAKARLSEYIEAVARGERVLICKRNQPVAELHPIATARTAPRPVGLAAGTFSVPDTFFEPLPDELVAAFDLGSDAGGLAHVAEAPPSDGYGTPAKRSRSRRA